MKLTYGDTSVYQSKAADMINHLGDESSKNLSSREDIYMDMSSRNNRPFKSKSLNKECKGKFSKEFMDKLGYNNINPYAVNK